MPSEPSLQRTHRLDAHTTALFALMWLLLVLHGWSPLVEYDAIWWLQLPAASADRMTSRDLELGEAVAVSGRLEREILELLYDTPERGRERGVVIWQDLISAVEQDGLALEGLHSLDGAHARLAVLLAEAGERDAAREAAERVRDPEGFADALCAAYGCQGDPTDAVELFQQARLTDWYLDRPRIALARSAGRVREADQIEAELRQRGDRWKLRSGSIAGVNLILVVIGAVLAATNLRRIRTLFAKDRNGPPWTLADGFGVFVRGDFWNRAYFVGIGYLDQIPGFGQTLASSRMGELAETWATLIAALPMLWLVHRHLIAPNGLTAVKTFGLAPKGRALRRTLGIAASAIAIDLAGSYMLGLATWGLGIESSWTEGFDEVLVWGTTSQAWLATIDYVAWAPAFEELAFRGVLFLSLRHRLGPIHAALVTAVFFAGMHFYTLPGFLMTLWSGFVWALAFERARSLLPGLFAHAAYNGLYVLGLVLLYR